jgi:hypothetical protein
MEAADALERRYRDRTVDWDGAVWRIQTVFATRNDLGRPAECAATGASIPLDERHLVVGVERRQYSYDHDYRMGRVVASGEALMAWVAAGPDAPDTDLTATRDAAGDRRSASVQE